jgi:hypothetical protein
MPGLSDFHKVGRIVVPVLRLQAEGKAKEWREQEEIGGLGPTSRIFEQRKNYCVVSLKGILW